MEFVNDIQTIRPKKCSTTLQPIYVLVLFGLYFPCIRSICFGLALSQAAGITHEYNHVGNTACSYWYGCVVWGVSNTMWRKDHIQHHRIVNSNRHHDPQFDLVPLFSQFNGETGIPFQKYLFLPIIILFGRINYQYASIVYILRHQLYEEMWGMMIHMGVMFMCLSNIYEWMMMYIINGISLHVLFILNHWCVPECHIYKKKLPVYGTEKYYKMQIEQTINFKIHPYLRWLCCGLDLHIEHHLFPNMKTNQLSSIQPDVKRLCLKYNIHYKQIGIWEALVQAIQRMD